MSDRQEGVAALVRLDSLRAEAERSNRPNPAMFTIATETALALIRVAERAIVCVEQRDVLATYQGDRLREALEAI